MDRQVDRQMDRQVGRQMDKKVGRFAVKQTDRKTKQRCSKTFFLNDIEMKI